MVRPSQRVEMARESVMRRSLGVRQACIAFSISACCYRYDRKLSSDNAHIAELLVGLTHSQRNWGFGLCFLYLRNVKGRSGFTSLDQSTAKLRWTVSLVMCTSLDLI